MFGWQYNEKMLKTYMVDHAEDMGRLFAELLYAAPKAYSDFWLGFSTALREKEDVPDSGRRPNKEGGSTGESG